MQVRRTLADNNTPQLCLLNAQISEFLTFWGTHDSIIAISSQSRGQHIVCVAARASEILPKRAGKSFASASSYSLDILSWFLSAYRLEFGFNSCQQFT